MATLGALEFPLRGEAARTTSSPNKPLSDSPYNAEVDTFKRGSGCGAYQDFIVPPLSETLAHSRRRLKLHLELFL